MPPSLFAGPIENDQSAREKTFFLPHLQGGTGGSMNGRANSCSSFFVAHHFDVVDVGEAPDEDVDVDQRG